MRNVIYYDSVLCMRTPASLTLCFFLGLRCLVLAAGVWEDSRPGYLYNVGAQKYIGAKYSHDENTEYLVGRSHMSSGVILITPAVAKDSSVQYMFIPNYPTVKKSFEAYSWPRNYNDPDLAYIRAFSTDSSAAHDRIVLGRGGRKNILRTFTISLDSISNQKYFRIFAGNECLSLDSDNYLVKTPCRRLTSEKSTRQLFKWIPKTYSVYPTKYFKTKYKLISDPWCPTDQTGGFILAHCRNLGLEDSVPVTDVRLGDRDETKNVRLYEDYSALNCC